MTVVARLEAILSANTAQFESAMTRSEARTQKMGKAAGVAGLAIAGGLAVGLEKSVKSAVSFQSSMELIHTQAGVAQKSIAGLSKSVLALAGPTATAPETLSTGLYHLTSQGLRGAKAIAALKIAAEGATVGQANLEDVTNALGGALASGIKGTKNMQQAMGAMNATVGAGDMRMQDLADAMGTGLPTNAAIAGVSLKDVSAALAVFGDNNIRGAKAGTLLGSAIRLMSAPSKAAAKELGTLGLKTTDLANVMRGAGGLPAALKLLQEKMDKAGLSASEQGVALTRAFGGRQATGVKILLDQFQRLQLKEEAVGKGASGFGEAWKSTSETTAFKFKQMQTSMESVGIVLGLALLPTVTKVAAELGKLTSYLSQHTTVAKIATVAIAALGTAFLLAAGYAKLMSSALVTKVIPALFKTEAGTWSLNAAMDANPIGAVILLLTALGVAFYIAYTKIKFFRDGVNEAWSWIKDHWPLILGILTGPVGLAVEQIIAHKDTLIRIFKNLPGEIASAFTSGAKAVKDAVTGLFGKVIDWVKGALGISSPSAVFHKIGQQSIQGFINGVGSMAGVLEHAVIHMATGALSHLNPFRGGHTKPAEHVNADAATNKQFALSQFPRFGWGPTQFPALNALWNQESGWNQYAKNKSSGAYGIPQALPPTKMPYAAQEKGGSSPVAQILWGLNYIKGRYGSPVAAEAHEQSVGWYDKGGWLPKGLSLALNTTGSPERVVGPGGGDTVIVQVGADEIARVVFDQIRGKAQVFTRRNGRLAFGGA